MKLKRIAVLLFVAVCLSLTTLTVGAADVPEYLPGDLNYDGFVNTTDVVILRRFIAGGYDIDLTPPHLKCDHIEIIDAAVAPTCTVPGLTEGKHCDKCDRVLVEQTVIPAKGHNMVDGVCTVCGFGSNAALNETVELALDMLNEEMFSLNMQEEGSELYQKFLGRVDDSEYFPTWRVVEDIFEEVYDDFEDALDVLLSKPFASENEGKYAIWELYTEAYLKAGNAVIEEFKVYAAEVYTERYEEDLDSLEEMYADRTDEASINAYNKKLAVLQKKYDAFMAAVEATPTYELSEIMDLELAKKYDPAYDSSYTEDTLPGYITADGVDYNMTKYIVFLIGKTIDEHTKIKVSADENESELLNDAAAMLIDDLSIFRMRLDPMYDGSDIYNEQLRGSEVVYMDGSNYKYDKYYSNTAKFEEMVAILDQAIEAIESIEVSEYQPVEVAVYTPSDTTFGSKAKKVKLYWINEQAKAWFEESGYDFEWLYRNEAAGAQSDEDKGLVISNSSRSGDFITLDDTGIPVTYTRTAEENAVLAAQVIYNDAYTAVHTMIMELTKYPTQAIKQITSAAEYKAILNNVKSNADLLTEVQDYAQLYVDKIVSVLGDKKSGFENNVFNTVATTNNFINRNEHFTLKAEVNNAERYVYENAMNAAVPYIDKFITTFYVDENRTDSTVIMLWQYRNYAIDYITEKINSYKNTYNVYDVNGTPAIEQIPGALYRYDEGLLAASARGAAFEAQLDELLAAYAAKIMTVKLSSQIVIKDTYGTQLSAKAGSFAWNFNTAHRSVNAFVVDLLGRDAAGEFAEGVSSPYSDTNFVSADGTVYVAVIPVCSMHLRTSIWRTTPHTFP